MERNDVPTPQVAVVAEDPTQRAVLEALLHQEGMGVTVHPSWETLADELRRQVPDVLVVDLDLPGGRGPEAVRLARRTYPRTPLVLLTGDRQLGAVVEAMRTGAYGYLTKPADEAQTLTTVRNALESSRLSRRVRMLERDAAGVGFGEIVGRSRAMRTLFLELDRLAPSEVPVLIRGEPGTGKEQVARAIHAHSGRSEGPFAAVDCGAVPSVLLEAELFGHEEGTSTGSTHVRSGPIERAHLGTLFLDEVGDVPLGLQGALLRTIQERAVTRMGGVRAIPTDFRLVAATRHDLEATVSRSEFRDDLFFRVSAFEVRLPPLRDRPDDIPVLAEHFIRSLARGKAVYGVTRRALDRMLAYAWPENVRELENAVSRALVTCGREIDVSDLPRRVTQATVHPRGSDPSAATGGPPDTLDLSALERWAVGRAVEACGGNLTEAARRLGIGRTTLYRKLDQYGLR